MTLDASMHLCVSGAVEVLYGATGDSRSPQAETACCHHRVPATHGRLYDILFSQGINYIYCSPVKKEYVRKKSFVSF